MQLNILNQVSIVNLLICCLAPHKFSICVAQQTNFYSLIMSSICVTDVYKTFFTQYCGDWRIRTADLCRAKAALYQLS